MPAKREPTMSEETSSVLALKSIWRCRAELSAICLQMGVEALPDRWSAPATG